MNCRERNSVSTAVGVERTKIQDTTRISASARIKPSAGEITIAEPVLIRPAQTIALDSGLGHAGADQPPIRACELDDGMPSAQVSEIPADRAHQRAENHLIVHDIWRRRCRCRLFARREAQKPERR